MKRIIRLTESDLTRIVKRVINENKNNTRYYTNRNLRRLGRTPVVMVESIDEYAPLLSEGILDTVKEKISSLIDKSKTFIREKAEDLKDSIKDSFDKPLDEITLDDIKDKLKELTGIDSEEDEKEEVMAERYYRKNKFLFEKDEMSFADKFSRADIGNNSLGEPIKDKNRIGQRILSAMQTIFGINVLSFGLLGSWLGSILLGAFIPWPVHMLVSIAAIVIITLIRQLLAVLSGNVNERYYRKYSRY